MEKNRIYPKPGDIIEPQLSTGIFIQWLVLENSNEKIKFMCIKVKGNSNRKVGDIDEAIYGGPWYGDSSTWKIIGKDITALVLYGN